MELDLITKMMVAAKQQILLYQATHEGQRLGVDVETTDTPDVTRFCLATADIVKAKVDELPPDDKFVLLNMLDNFLHKIRVDVAHEYILCENCATYIRRDNLKVVEKTNCIERYCPTCGKLHRWELK